MTTPGQPPPEPPPIEDVTLDLTPFVNVPATPGLSPQARTIQEKQENVRGRLAQGLTIIFAVVLILPFVLHMFSPDSWDNAQEWLQVTLPAITGLLGSAMGFYFGQRNN